MSSSQPVQKQRNYAQLASRLNDFKNTTSEYERLLDRLADQHKALSDMGAWHAAQFMTIWRLVLIEESTRVSDEDENDAQPDSPSQSRAP